jgi:hypothetical protein
MIPVRHAGVPEQLTPFWLAYADQRFLYRICNIMTQYDGRNMKASIVGKYCRSWWIRKNPQKRPGTVLERRRLHGQTGPT